MYLLDIYRKLNEMQRKADVFDTHSTIETTRSNGVLNYNRFLTLRGDLEKYGLESVLADNSSMINRTVVPESTGAGGSIEFTKYLNRYNDLTKFPVEPQLFYRFALRAKIDIADGVDAASVIFYIKLSPLNVMGDRIQNSEVNFMSGTATTLTKDLNNGDTRIWVSSHASWDKTTTEAHRKVVNLWRVAANGKHAFTETNGFIYSEYGYTRAVSSRDIWADENSFGTDPIDGDYIDLPSAWGGIDVYKVGTAIAQGSSGSAYIYPIYGNIATDGNWHILQSGVLGGIQLGGINNSSPTDGINLFWKDCFGFQYGGLYGYRVYDSNVASLGGFTADMGKFYVAEQTIFVDSIEANVRQLV